MPTSVYLRSFKSDVRLSSFDDGVSATREALDDERPESFRGCVVLSALMVAGDGKGNCDFRHIPSGLDLGRKQRLLVLSNIRYLVGHAGLLILDNDLDVLRIVQCSLSACLTLIELLYVLTNGQTALESRLAEVHRLEERVRVTEDDSEALYMAHVRVNELMSGCASLTAVNEHAWMEGDTLAACVCELVEAAATHDGEVGVVVRSVRS